MNDIEHHRRVLKAYDPAIVGELPCGLVCPTPIFKMAWARWCYALYSLIDDIAQYNGTTFDKVIQDEKQRKNITTFFRRFDRTPWALYSPAAVRSFMNGGILPPLKDKETGEILGEFLRFMRVSFLYPYSREIQERPLPPEGYQDAVGLPYKEFSFARACTVLQGKCKKLQEENSRLTHDLKEAGKTLDIYKNENSGLHVQIDEWYKPTIDELQERVERLEKELESLKHPPKPPIRTLTTLDDLKEEEEIENANLEALENC